MNALYETEYNRDRQLEVVELLDERFRLREDPSRRSELEQAHARLREKLHDVAETEERPREVL